MKTTFLIATLFSVAALFSACKKDVNIIDGTYKGTFTVTYSSGVQTGQTTLELKNGRFSCSGNANRIPAGGSGSYSSDKNTITFQDEKFWTADFDWNLILNGTYAYSFDGKILTFSADKNGVGKYAYAIERQ